MAENFPAGAHVRLKNDPGRDGAVTGRVRERGGTRYLQVRFADGASFQPEYALELMPDDEDMYTAARQARFGSLEDFRRNITHIQLTGRLANLVYSMDTTNTDFYAYQFKPVLLFLESPSNGMLIADEVGLGKTIEAGLIWTELRARYDARRLLVVCPAMLRDKWKQELHHRFSVQARLTDAAGLLEELQRSKHEVADGQALVCSMQGIRPPRGWDSDDEEVRRTTADSAAARLAHFLQEAATEEPPIDMVIIDESHYMRNPETSTARLGELLRGATDHIVLLSATPINLRSEDLFHQLRLVDPDYFQHQGSFPDVLAANEPLLRARELVLDSRSTAEDVKQTLALARAHYLLRDNGQLARLLDGGITAAALRTPAGRIRVANRIERINLLANTVTRTRKRDVHELRVVRKPESYFVRMHTVERAVYDAVTAAIEEYAESADINTGFLLAGPQRRVSSCIWAAVNSWRDDRPRSDLELYEDFGLDEVGEPEHDRPLRNRLRQEILPTVDLELLRQHDTKYAEFRAVVVKYLQDHADEKMVVFSYYPGTLEYLASRLEEDGLRSLVLHGGTQRPKQEVIGEFQHNSKVRLLLSSEVASEGVDLQFCRVLVNYDLPWNPMKIEQRIGRIDRVGQRSEKISILNMGHSGTIDQQIYERLLMRLGTFEQALGGMEEILGEKIQQLTKDVFSPRLTRAEKEARIEQSAKALERVRQQNEELEAKATHMIAHGGYILEQVQAAHDFKRRVTSEDLQVYLGDYLNRYWAGFTLRQHAEDKSVFNIGLPADLASELARFMKGRRMLGQSRLVDGGVYRCRFLNRLVPMTRQEEVISQFHPLIRYINEDLRQRKEAHHPLVAMSVLGSKVDGELEAGVYAFVMQRWSFQGLRSEELLQARMVHMASGDVIQADLSLNALNQARLDGESWLAASSHVSTDTLASTLDRCFEAMEADYQEMLEDKTLENEDRVRFQMGSAERHAVRQREMQQEVLFKHMMLGRSKLIPAVEGKIRKIEERFEVRKKDLELKKRLGGSWFELCGGVVRVT